MQKDIAIIVPHKGLGDIIFHHSFIKSVHNHHKKKLYYLQINQQKQICYLKIINMLRK